MNLRNLLDRGRARSALVKPRIIFVIIAIVGLAAILYIYGQGIIFADTNQTYTYTGTFKTFSGHPAGPNKVVSGGKLTLTRYYTSRQCTGGFSQPNYQVTADSHGIYTFNNLSVGCYEIKLEGTVNSATVTSYITTFKVAPVQARVNKRSKSLNNSYILIGSIGPSGVNSSPTATATSAASATATPSSVATFPIQMAITDYYDAPLAGKRIRTIAPQWADEQCSMPLPSQSVVVAEDISSDDGTVDLNLPAGCYTMAITEVPQNMRDAQSTDEIIDWLKVVVTLNGETADGNNIVGGIAQVGKTIMGLLHRAKSDPTQTPIKKPGPDRGNIKVIMGANSELASGLDGINLMLTGEAAVDGQTRTGTYGRFVTDTQGTLLINNLPTGVKDGSRVVPITYTIHANGNPKYQCTLSNESTGVSKDSTSTITVTLLNCAAPSRQGAIQGKVIVKVNGEKVGDDGMLEGVKVQLNAKVGQAPFGTGAPIPTNASGEYIWRELPLTTLGASGQQIPLTYSVYFAEDALDDTIWDSVCTPITYQISVAAGVVSNVPQQTLECRGTLEIPLP